jgi:UDP-4-amino-4-deoxy-L-arabinose formyltransferase/UDP-glucuronic acid dehydrogenase (UDP-4-keto-hexauronic acid decarboxylating)
VQTLRVFLAAEEGAGTRALQAVTAAGHQVLGLLCSAAPGGPAALARSAGIPVLGPETRNEELAAEVRRARIDLLLNVHSLRILGPEVLEAPAIGCFNLHPGPLPRFAGLNAPSWAIFEGEARYGCSLHRMTAEVDAGPLAYAATFEVAPRETGISLAVKCTKRGLPLLEALLKDVAADPRAIPSQEQDLAARRYLHPGPPCEGQVPWAAPAARVDAFVRACTYDPYPSPWGTPATSVAGRTVGIKRLSPTGRAATEAPGTVGEARDGAVEVAAADEWLLIEEVRVDGEAARPADVLPPGARCDPTRGA